jgi:hypothetical protein
VPVSKNEAKGFQRRLIDNSVSRYFSGTAESVLSKGFKAAPGRMHLPCKFFTT